MNAFGKIAACASLLLLANGIRAQTPAGLPVFKITKDDSSVEQHRLLAHAFTDCFWTTTAGTPHSPAQNVSRSCPQTMSTGEEPLGKSPPTLAARTMTHCWCF